MAAQPNRVPRQFHLLLSATTALLLLLGCAKNSVLNPNAPASPTYSSISSVILQPGCVSCHGSAAGYSYDTYVNTIKSVKAGDTSGSPLFLSVKFGSMPKGGNKLSQEQVRAIGDWIMANAPDN